MAFNWTCPHCNRPQTVTSENHGSTSSTFFTCRSIDGYLATSANCIVCSNTECLKASVDISILEAYKAADGRRLVQKDARVIFHQQLMPLSLAKPQPEFIPESLRQDYFEACLILDLSPKACATLARRCLQGMIRDFCQISDKTLDAEIRKLMVMEREGNAPKGVSPESIEAIDHVRRIGNIGAHMEKDINFNIPVEPEEAKILIELIETLFDEWYIAQNKRTRRFETLRNISDDKQLLRIEGIEQRSISDV